MPLLLTLHVMLLLLSVRVQLLINGEWRDAAAGKTMPVIDPRTEQAILQVNCPYEPFVGS
jgi:hypothetical protein